MNDKLTPWQKDIIEKFGNPEKALKRFETARELFCSTITRKDNNDAL